MWKFIKKKMINVKIKNGEFKKEIDGDRGIVGF
jgi:hypothetical protein